MHTYKTTAVSVQVQEQHTSRWKQFVVQGKGRGVLSMLVGSICSSSVPILLNIYGR